jgi:hypothetical protein
VCESFIQANDILHVFIDDLKRHGSPRNGLRWSLTGGRHGDGREEKKEAFRKSFHFGLK